MVACDMERCCALCRFWVDGSFKVEGIPRYDSQGMGFCQNPGAKRPLITGGAVYEGNAGIETHAACECPKYEAAPVRYRKPS